MQSFETTVNSAKELDEKVTKFHFLALGARLTVFAQENKHIKLLFRLKRAVEVEGLSKGLHNSY